MRQRLIDTVSGPAMVLVAGRAVGFAALFLIPVVLARVFNRAEFGTYKQLFLVFSTLFGIAQLGMAESLYYFVPRKAHEAGHHVANSIVTLALAGIGCLVLLVGTRGAIADWLGNSQLGDHLFLLGTLLALTLVATVFEIVMISRAEYAKAAVTYASSDLTRAALFVIPALGFGGVGAVLVGAVVFGVLRVAAMAAYLWRTFGRGLTIDLTLWRDQLAYALPFALAVGIEVVQTNFHQYFVAARFDAATFAIYAVGCLQIPLVDLVMTSTVNVMMVEMAEHARDGDRRGAIRLWHAAISKLALVLFPLAIFLIVAARPVIVTLFTARYLASVPIFMVWTLTILPSAFAVDGVLRLYAQTRFLLLMNIVRFAIVIALIGPFLSAFGMSGAVLVTLLGTSVAKAAGGLRIARLLAVGVRDALPWKRLTGITLGAVIAAVPELWIVRTMTTVTPLVVLACAAAAYAVTYGALLLGAAAAARQIAPASFSIAPAAGMDNPAEFTRRS